MPNTNSNQPIPVDDLIAEFQASWNSPSTLFTEIQNLSADENEWIKKWGITPPATRYILQQGAWWVVMAWNHYIENYLSPNTPFSDVNDFFKSLQGTAQYYNDNIKTKTVELAQEVVNHANDAPGQWDTISNAIMMAYTSTDPATKNFMNAVTLKTFKDMKDLADQQAANANAIYNSMEEYEKKIEAAIITDNTLTEEYTSKSGKLAQQISRDNEELKLENSIKDDLHSEYEKWCKLAETAPVYLVIPFVGIFISVADAITFATLAIVWLGKYNDEVDKINVLTDKIADENSDLTRINAVTPTLTNISKGLAAVKPLIQLMANSWSTYSSEIDNLSKLTDAAYTNGISGDPNKLIAAFSGIGAVKSNWEAVKTDSVVWIQTADITSTIKTAPSGQEGMQQLKAALGNAIQQAKK